jgi:pSer/pThr/pTyr-binding forkhead associated (FHA) protein
MARLVLLSEGLTGRTFDLKGAKTTVGRVPDNDFQIAEASVSSHHCELHLQGKDVLVKDLDSTNGTFVNGERVTETVLKPGQILRLGMIEMRLESGDASPGAGAGTGGAKKVLDKTLVIPQGVKLDELEGTRAPLKFDKGAGFEQKTNFATKVFVTAAVLVGVVLVVLLLIVVMK